MQNFQLLGWEQALGMLWYSDPMIQSESFFREIWVSIDGDDRPHSDSHRVSSQSVLDILNEAVWAPNDGLREPWRFIYVTGNETVSKLGTSYEEASLSYLLVVAKEEADPHKREEDYAAVCCLIQNFNCWPNPNLGMCAA